MRHERVSRQQGGPHSVQSAGGQKNKYETRKFATQARSVRYGISSERAPFSFAISLRTVSRRASEAGGHMISAQLLCRGMAAILFVAFALPAGAQSFEVQCPDSTITHPAANNNSEPAYAGATTFTTGADGYQVPTSGTVNGAIKCQQISGGDGFVTMGDGTQMYLFAFGPLSGLF